MRQFTTTHLPSRQPAITRQPSSIRCTEIVDDITTGETISFLRSDTNIDCRSDKHQSFLRIIIPLILVYQLIPVMYFVLLFRVRHKLNPRDIDETTALRIVQSNRTDPDVIPLRFLFKGYSKHYWFWECLEAYRRMVFISGLPLFDSPINRGITGSVVSWGCALIYREVPPFKQTTTNLLNICTLQQITLTFFMATLIETGALVEYGGLNSYAIGSVLTCVNLAFVVAAFGFAYRFFQIKKKKEAEVQKTMNEQLVEYAGSLSNRKRTKSISERGRHDDDDELPAAMKEFVPIGQTPVIVEATEGLPEIEKLFLKAHFQDTVVAGMSERARGRQGLEDESGKSSSSNFMIMGKKLGTSVRGALGNALSADNTQLPTTHEEDAEAGAEEKLSDRGNSSGRLLPLMSPMGLGLRNLSMRAGTSVASYTNSSKDLKAMPGGADDVPSILALRTQLVEKLQALQPLYADTVAKRCNEDNVIPTCDAVLSSSSRIFSDVYLAVWNLVIFTDEDAIDDYVAAVGIMKRKAEEEGGQARQRYRDIVVVYSHAAAVHRMFSKFMKQVQEDTRAKLDMPSSLKSLSRILEKSLFGRDPGSVESVCDVVRGMLTVTSMVTVTKVAFAFLENQKIVIVRIKDRFVEKPSPGGWRDLMINFYFIADPNRHVCEVQVVHSRMLVARQGLPGHLIYDRVRNAQEILEKLGVSNVDKRAENARRLMTSGEDFGQEMLSTELLRLGYKAHELLRAGFTDATLKSCGVLDKGLEEVCEGRQGYLRYRMCRPPPATRHPPLATRHPPPATRYPPPATRHPGVRDSRYEAQRGRRAAWFDD